MVKLWKRCGAWVTALKSDLFLWARIKLTALYLLIVAIILLVFSLALYNNFSLHVRRDFAHGPPPPPELLQERETLAEDAIERAQDSILTVDAFVYLLAAFLSYTLAGYTLKPIRKAMDAQQAFSADASHELRTPLAVMRTDIEVLLRGQPRLPAEVQEVLKSNLEEIQIMSAMTEELLELSRGRELQLEQRTRLDLSRLAAGLADKLRKLAGEKHVALSFQGSMPVWILGYPNNLERMLKNLLSNAISYTPSGGKILLAVSQNGRYAELSVTDTGIGISELDLPYVFDRFYKADHSRSQIKTGSGLGLAIVKQIVQQHQGSIAIKSAVDRGTVVTIRLPAASKS